MAETLENIQNPELHSQIQQWLSWDKNEETLSEVKNLVLQSNIDALSKLFLSRISFGTAGLRGRMGPGYTQMNDLVIVQTTQGLVTYIESCFPDAKTRGVVVGYDGRHNSKRFAMLTANIFLRKGIPVHLFSRVCPTPFVAYSVCHFKCIAGVMVTASHNPKEDNGYKVYWDNGALIISPHDKGIQQSILDNLTPWIESWNLDSLEGNPLLKDPLESVMRGYFQWISELTLSPEANADTNLKFTYSAMHGVGATYMAEAFKAANLKPFIAVDEQKDPNPDFPTVKFPNPEEGKSALDLSIRTANENDSTIILANDPDADRLAVAEKVNGEWKIFTGNELGCLLGWWSLFVYRRRYGDNLDDVYMLSSTVSSKILNTMAQAEGFNFVETLTGFKWIANKSYELELAGKKVLFGFEEAIGFMTGLVVRDKDGVSAGMRVAEMAVYLEKKGLTLEKKLRQLYEQYGQHISLNSYYICHDQELISRIFERIRTFGGSANSYPSSILDGRYKITFVRDLTTGYDSSQADGKAILPVSSSSQMVTFTFDNGLVATLRTSGTEPKIKYYTEMCASPTETDIGKIRHTQEEMVDAIIEEFLEPGKNGLIPRSV